MNKHSSKAALVIKPMYEERKYSLATKIDKILTHFDASSSSVIRSHIITSSDMIKAVKIGLLSLNIFFGT